MNGGFILEPQFIGYFANDDCGLIAGSHRQREAKIAVCFYLHSNNASLLTRIAATGGLFRSTA